MTRAAGAAPSRLARYNEMRDFGRTSEPSGEEGRSETGRSFVVQKHAARRLHYDFRLELDGVLLSWAVPKGPSLAPGDKRLAIQTEDHPIDYRDFEGTIPEGQYGAGAVIVWDRGTWSPVGDPHDGLERGRLEIELEGEKLHGRFLLVRTKRDESKPSWLLMKRTDPWARSDGDVVAERPESLLTGRTIEEVEAGVPAIPPHAPRPKQRRTQARARRQKEPLDGAVELPPFGSISPQLAVLVDDVPSAGPWIYELKYDGYRTMAWLDDGEVRMASRRGLDWTTKYGAIADALARVRAKTAIFDGEVAYVCDDGRTDFQKLQHALATGAPREQARLVYFLFDLLHYDGVDLRDEPLSFRKDKLRTILAGEEPPLMMSGDVDSGGAFLREACKLGLEGIIGKRADRPYRSRRSPDWIKLKCHRRQELVVVGYTPQKGSREGLGALLLGVYEDGELRYAGKVGTGFSAATAKDLVDRLSPLQVPAPPVVDPPRSRVARWVRPELVCEVRFTEWTSDGSLRHPSFEGLRLDKPAREVRRELARAAPKVRSQRPQEEAPAASTAHADHLRAARAREAEKPRVRGVVVTNPTRVMDRDTGLSKLELVEYAGTVADAMLPYVAKRPLMLLRCPSGTEASVFRQSDRRKGRKSSCFVQKHAGQGLQAANLGSASAEGEEVLYVTNAKQIAWLAQNNTVEMHGWGSTMPKWDRADWIVFDLDPDEALPFSRVIDSAFELREALRTLGLESWVKTTGGKGLHVTVPITRRYDWTTIRLVAERIAVLMTEAAPDRYVATMSKKARVGKVFVDYLRNARGATAVLPYSARARPGLPVALPVSWEDLRAVDPSEFTIATVPRIVARGADPWAELLRAKQTLPRELLASLER